MMTNARCRLLASAAIGLAGALASAPASRATTSADTAIGSAIGLTVYLKMRNEAGAEAAARAMQTPGSASFHRFLSVAQFDASYAPTPATIRQTINALTQLGYTVNTVFANHLAIEVIAPATTVESTLGIRLNRAARGARTGLVPDRAPTLPAVLAETVRNIGGLDTLHVAHPMRVRAAVALPPGAETSRPAAGATLTGGTPGDYLPADFASRYDVNPIYRAGATGAGATIGIVTLANYFPSDAYTFWRDIGLAVSPTRLATVDVDGGTTPAPSDALGEGETDIDVEESGGLAPGANVRVYVSPNNTNANFVDGFEAAASENIADTVSTSWGEPELFYFAGVGQPDETATLDDFHAVFLEMALQGQTIYVASGDSGAFDTVRDCPDYGTPSATNPVCDAPFAVDSPSDDPLVTAAGGTTVPFTLKLKSGATLSVSTERAWSWDYILQQDPAVTLNDLFSTGDGGGVSSYWARPFYQAGVPGIADTKPGQSFTENTGAGAVTVLTLPSGFAGRNMPDIATDADPESGYQYVEENQIQNFFGGTSFVAPQLNGVTALFVQALGGRLGQVNPLLYAFGPYGTTDVTTGDNWGYQSVAGYDNAGGVGTLDAARALVGFETLRNSH